MNIEQIYADIPYTEMIFIQGGRFIMGDDKSGYNAEKPAHEVELNSFCMGRYPVTQALWEAVMGKKENRARIRGSRRPIERVSWYDAVVFCNLLSDIQMLESVYTIDKSQEDSNNQDELDKQKWRIIANHQASGYRLPTEAEWEYAAKGGIYNQNYEYSGSDDMDRVCWYDKNSYKETRAVGLKLPNELGLYDMSGNVWEWCWNWYGTYMNSTDHFSGSRRTNRGGSWDYNQSYSRIVRRSRGFPRRRLNVRGFRLSRTAIEWGT